MLLSTGVAIIKHIINLSVVMRLEKMLFSVFSVAKICAKYAKNFEDFKKPPPLNFDIVTDAKFGQQVALLLL